MHIIDIKLIVLYKKQRTNKRTNMLLEVHRILGGVVSLSFLELNILYS